MVSQSVLDEIRNRLSIVSFIGEYVPLKKAGRNFKGLCPFHAEKTPSFTATEDKQIFHCFGCGAGGDIFTFVMKYNGLTFPEALKELAKKAGVKLPEYEKDSKADAEFARKKQFAFRLNEIASDHFVKTLHDKQKGKEALDYLLTRGLKKETIDEYRLGYADKSWDGLYNAISKTQAPLDLAVAIGLIRKKEKQEGYFDFFRDRVIFPIQDLEGKIIGFGGRTLAKDEGAKYLNSPDSLLYSKSRSAFGLFQAKEAVRKMDEAILVEGYMDCLALHEAGIQNAVAPLGTALTTEQIRLLSRYTKNFALAFDGDAAGKKAALRALPLFLEVELTPKAIVLPEGVDPDVFIRKEGIEAWEKLKKNAPTLFEFFVSTVARAAGTGTQGKLKAWGEIQPIFRMVRNELEAGIYKKLIAEKLGVEEGWLKGEGQRTTDNGQRTNDKREEANFPQEERLLIAAMILKPSTIPTVEKAGEIFTNPSLQKIATQLFSAFADKGSVTLAEVQEHLDENLGRWIRELALGTDEKEGWEKAVRDCLNKIGEKKLSETMKQLSERITAAETEGNEKELLNLLTQKTKLLKEGRTS